MNDNNKQNSLKWLWQKSRYAIIVSVVWCTFMAFLYQNASTINTKHMEEQMLTQAQTLYSFVLDTRNWNSRHGGVYVRESDYGIANKWIPENKRSISMSDGTRFVLINPAYMSRQISENSNLPGAFFKITSPKPLRTENKADAWEMKAFEKNALGETEVYSYVYDGFTERFRYLKPLFALESCLYCHKDVAIGDVLGGISVSLDVRHAMNNVSIQNKNLLFAYAFVALVGTIFICFMSFSRYRKAQLKEAQEKMKEAFIANMSHDMRTPLSGIMGMTQLLERETCPDEQEKIIKYLHLASASLLEMVSDITDYAALNAQSVHLNSANFDIRFEIEQCCAIFLPQCNAKGLEFKLNIASDVPKYLIGDSFRIRQVLGNLINNAVKFTEYGKIDVTVKFNDDILCLEVQDTGYGIAKDEQEDIFVRFERGQSAKHNDRIGTGLGLSIVQEVVQLMEGSISVNSELGKGSCFRVFIPTKVGQGLPDCAQAQEMTNEDISALGIQVLLVEDSRPTAFFVQALLEKVGCHVHVAMSGEHALELLTTVRPHVVLMDMRMPGMDGVETAAHIRAYECCGKTPIILMSASVLDVDEQKLQSLGIEKVLLKPVVAKDIIDLVSAARVTEQSLPIFDYVAVFEMLNNDDKLLNKLIRVWVDDYDSQHNKLLLTIKAGQKEQIRAIAHSIKNSAATLCLTHLQHAAELVELHCEDGDDCSNLIEAHINAYNYLSKRV